MKGAMRETMYGYIQNHICGVVFHFKSQVLQISNFIYLFYFWRFKTTGYIFLELSGNNIHTVHMAMQNSGISMFSNLPQNYLELNFDKGTIFA